MKFAIDYVLGRDRRVLTVQASDADDAFAVGRDELRRLGFIGASIQGTARALTEHLAVGELVTVGPAYRMGGAFVPDGFEGEYTVVGVAGHDYKLVRGDHRHDALALADDGLWDACINEARIARF